MLITCNITASIWLLNRFGNQRIWKTNCYFFSTTLPKKYHLTKSKKGKKCQYMGIVPEFDHSKEHHVTNAENVGLICNKLWLPSHFSIFVHKFFSTLSTTSFLSRSPMAHNTAASLDSIIVMTMWTLANTKTDFEKFLGPNVIRITWEWNWKISIKKTIEIADC